ncbi:unnamed protein product [Linum trigynum]|uniref:Uncharacterized protein n=1 Tax=Linum trigynum TaxID=586398 RepID=A0AAV2GPL5_9ROSI
MCAGSSYVTQSSNRSNSTVYPYRVLEASRSTISDTPCNLSNSACHAPLMPHHKMKRLVLSCVMTTTPSVWRYFLSITFTQSSSVFLSTPNPTSSCELCSFLRTPETYILCSLGLLTSSQATKVILH